MKKKQISIPQYSGPTREQVYALSDRKVLAELQRFGEEPRKPYPVFDMQEDLDNWHIPTPEEWALWATQAKKHHKQCLKGQLHWAYIRAFVKTLSDKVKWEIVEHFELKHMKSATSEDFTVSAKRYTTPAQLLNRAVTAVHNSQPREEPNE